MTPEKLTQSIVLQKKIDLLGKRISNFKSRLNPQNASGWEKESCTRINFIFRHYNDYESIENEDIQTSSEVFQTLYNIALNRLIIRKDELQKLFDSL